MGGRKRFLTPFPLMNSPVYDTLYCAEWAQPYGLLHIAALLNTHGYKKLGVAI